jgi:plastocyanin
MKKQSIAVIVASLALLTACSGEPEAAAESVAGEASEAAGDAAGEASEAAEPTEDASEGATAGSGAAGESSVLLGTVGTAEDPDAFEIALTTEDGQPVEELPAGDYTIRVNDPSAIHNFHLTGGSVDEKTTVPETGEMEFEVTLEAGEYTYTCDPHPPMTGTFNVT